MPFDEKKSLLRQAGFGERIIKELSMDQIKLHVCLFDKNCEEVLTETILTLDEADTQNNKNIFNKFYKLANSDENLKRIAEELGAYDFRAWMIQDVTIQTDTRDSLIRLRDIGDTIGEPGNIAMMVNLRLVEE